MTAQDRGRAPEVSIWLDLPAIPIHKGSWSDRSWRCVIGAHVIAREILLVVTLLEDVEEDANIVDAIEDDLVASAQTVRGEGVPREGFPKRLGVTSLRCGCFASFLGELPSGAGPDTKPSGRLRTRQ